MVTYATKRIKCRHCGKWLILKQATDGTWIILDKIKKGKEVEA